MEHLEDKGLGQAEEGQSFVWNIVKSILGEYAAALYEVILLVASRLIRFGTDQQVVRDEETEDAGQPDPMEEEEDEDDEDGEYLDCDGEDMRLDLPTVADEFSRSSPISVSPSTTSDVEEDFSDTGSERPWSCEPSSEHPDASSLIQDLLEENAYGITRTSRGSPSSPPSSSTTEDSGLSGPYHSLRRRRLPRVDFSSPAPVPHSGPATSVTRADDAGQPVGRAVPRAIPSRGSGLDVANLVPQNKTALEVMREICPNFAVIFPVLTEEAKGKMRAALQGCIVRTSYNDSFYIVQGVDFEQSPLTKPPFARGKTYQQWLLADKKVAVPVDIKQPILKAVLVTNRPVKPTADLASLVPQFCLLYGTKLLDGGASTTPATPSNVDAEFSATRSFFNTLRERRKIKGVAVAATAPSSGASAIASLPFSSAVRIQQQDKTVTIDAADDLDQDGNFQCGTLEALASSSHKPVRLEDGEWLVTYFEAVESVVGGFVQALQKEAHKRGCHFGRPILFQMAGTELFRKSLWKQFCETRHVKLIVYINPSDDDNKERYRLLKDATLRTVAIPSQVFLDVNIMDIMKQRNIVVPNVMAQIISKLSGIPRQVQMNNFKTETMAVGIFKMHRPGLKHHQVVASCATTENGCSETFNSQQLATNDMEVVECVCDLLQEALAAYASKNDARLPQNLLVFRGAVTQGQEVAIRTAEIPAIIRRLKEQGLDIALTYVVEYGVRSFEKVLTDTDTTEGYSLVICEESGEACFWVIPKNAGKLEAPFFRVVIDQSDLGVSVLADFSFRNSFMYMNKNGKHTHTALVGNARKNAHHTATVYSGADCVGDEALKHSPFFL